MRRWLPALVLLIAAPALAAPGDMSVAAFLRRAEELQAMGPLAAASPKLDVLRLEGNAAKRSYYARLANERRLGKPSSCPPPGADTTVDRFLGHLRSYPLARRGAVSMNTAVADYFIRTWPCHR
jgi:hypothetical protein